MTLQNSNLWHEALENNLSDVTSRKLDLNSEHLYKVYPLKMESSVTGYFCCENCGRTWYSRKCTVTFLYKLEPQKEHGQIEINEYGQRCQKCSYLEIFTTPTIDYESADRAASKLKKKLLEKFYGEPVPQPKGIWHERREIKKPHDMENCAACLSGLCVASEERREMGEMAGYGHIEKPPERIFTKATLYGPNIAQWNIKLNGTELSVIGGKDEHKVADKEEVALHDHSIYSENVSPHKNHCSLFEVTSATSFPSMSRPKDMPANNNNRMLPNEFGIGPRRSVGLGRDTNFTSRNNAPQNLPSCNWSESPANIRQPPTATQTSGALEHTCLDTVKLQRSFRRSIMEQQNGSNNVSRNNVAAFAGNQITGYDIDMRQTQHSHNDASTENRSTPFNSCSSSTKRELSFGNSMVGRDGRSREMGEEPSPNKMPIKGEPTKPFIKKEPPVVISIEDDENNIPPKKKIKVEVCNQEEDEIIFNAKKGKASPWNEAAMTKFSEILIAKTSEILIAKTIAALMAATSNNRASRRPLESVALMENNNQAVSSIGFKRKASNDFENDASQTPTKMNEAIESKNVKVDSEGFVEVYVDGVCRNNGKDIARAGVGVWWGHDHQLNVSRPVKEGKQTKIVAVIQAANIAIELAVENGINKLLINTNNWFLNNSVTGWISNWKKNGWMTKSKQPVKNREDLEELDKAINCGSIQVKWNYRKGHGVQKGNEEVEKLAMKGACM